MVIKSITFRNQWLVMTLFAVAMGLLESVVVVYLRALYYPEGFGFPLKAMKPEILGTEIAREAATIIMLLSIGILIGKSKTEKFAWFIYSFGIWDIFYYFFLKILLGWPENLMTWDILFLIPTTWVSPVICPILNSLSMILLAAVILIPVKLKKPATIKAIEWMLLITGSLFVILAYTNAYFEFLLEKFRWTEFIKVDSVKQMMAYTAFFVPKNFHWLLFNCGVFMHCTVIISVFRRRKTDT